MVMLVLVGIAYLIAYFGGMMWLRKKLNVGGSEYPQLLGVIIVLAMLGILHTVTLVINLVLVLLL